MGWQWHQQEQVSTGLMSLLLPINSVKALHGTIQTQMTVHKFKRTKLSYTVRSLCYCCAQNALVLIFMHYYYYYICLMDIFSSKTWVSRHQKGKPFWILLKREKMGKGRWHQLDHMQIICTSLQINNHHSVFYRPDAVPAAQPTASKH